MRNTLASVFALLLSYGLLLLANGLFATLIGVRTKIEGFSNEVVGFIASGYFVGLLVGAFLAVRVVASVGHIRAFAVFASLMSISALAHPLWINAPAWAVMRSLAGFSMAGMIMVTESWLNERSNNQNRGRVLALYMITNYFAAGCGQYILPLADPGGFKLFSIASIIFSLALVPVLLTHASAPRPVPLQRASIADLWRLSPLGSFGVFCAGLTNSVFYGLGPVYAHDIGLSLTQTSTFMASVIAGGLLLQWPVGRLSDRIDRRTVLTGVALVSAAAAAAIVVTTGGRHLWLYATGIVYGGFTFTLYSISSAHANDFADPEQRVRTSSGLLITYAVGAVIGPIIAGLLMGALGARGLFAWTGIVYMTLGSFAFVRILSRRARAKGEQGRIIHLPGGQYTAGRLYKAVRNQMDRDLAHLSGSRH